MAELHDIYEPKHTTSNDSEEIQHQTESEKWMPRFETQLPSKIKDSSDSMISVVYQEPDNENESKIRSLITACELPADVEEKLKALQTFDQTFNIFVSETGKISLKYNKSKTRVSFQDMCRLIFEIPRTNFTTQVKKETFEKLARKQKDSKGCLVRYQRHNLKGPYYIQCWIHKCLVIILAYGDKSNTNCEALLTWIKSKGQHETAEEVPPDGTEPSDSKNKNYKTVFYVESNEEEVKEIPRHVYKKMEARHIQSVCVPLKGSETNLIAYFVQYFSKKAKKIGRKRKMFLEMCISVEEEEDVIFCEARATLEKAVDPKMFKFLKLSGFGLEDNCHGTLSPIEVELDTDSIEKVAEKVDVLVNSTNTYLDLTRGFVERQIIELGGKTIQEECKREKKKDTYTYGEVCKTSAGLLHCRKIYHVALYEPWIPACKFSLEILAASVVQCLNELEKDGFKSIAFPALGTGKLGYPYYPVAKTMCNVIHAYGKRNPRTKIERIYFFLYDKEELCKSVRKKDI
uniref:Macro domain-containing protein n=1 Tax=Magallana gigas TaxID=29159 RepID=A0A8W8K1W2_MAGGI